MRQQELAKFMVHFDMFLELNRLDLSNLVMENQCH
jgi:hypothetical protein